MLNQSAYSQQSRQSNAKIAEDLKENIQIFNIVSSANPLKIKLPEIKDPSCVVAKQRSNKFLDITDFTTSVIFICQETYNFNDEDEEYQKKTYKKVTPVDQQQTQEQLDNEIRVEEDNTGVYETVYEFDEEEENKRVERKQHKAFEIIKSTAYDMIQLRIPHVTKNEVYNEFAEQTDIVEIAIPKSATQNNVQTPMGTVNVHHVVYGLTNNPAENIDVGTCPTGEVHIYISDSYNKHIKFLKPYSMRLKVYDVQMF